MNLEIISPEKTIFRGTVEKVTLPSVKGSFTILNNHAPIVTALQKGIISYSSMTESNIVEIESGFVEAKNNNITVCVE